MTFPEQLKFHRERLKITRQAMAELLGISPKTYSIWEEDNDPIRKPSELTKEGALARLEAVVTPQASAASTSGSR